MGMQRYFPCTKWKTLDPLVYIFILWNGVSATSFLPIFEFLAGVDLSRCLYHSTSLERRARERQRIRDLRQASPAKISTEGYKFHLSPRGNPAAVI